MHLQKLLYVLQYSILISTNTSSAHIKTLLKNDKVCIYFSDDKTFEGVCFYGKAIVHFEREYKELLWNEGDEKYYPKGIDDEDYCILEIVADSGRYYGQRLHINISSKNVERP